MDGERMKPWKTLSRRTVFAQPPWVTVEQHAVELPGGRVIADWPWVVTPDYVNIVPVTAADRVLCFRQTKYAVGGETLALVGGYIEPGEAPLAAAKRELLEETGHAAVDWQPLGTYYADANRGCGAGHLYLALGAAPAAAINADDLEQQELIELSLAGLIDAVDRGEFRVLPWAAAAALAVLRLMRR